jgi:hypothetical protein
MMAHFAASHAAVRAVTGQSGQTAAATADAAALQTFRTAWDNCKTKFVQGCEQVEAGQIVPKDALPAHFKVCHNHPSVACGANQNMRQLFACVGVARLIRFVHRV